MKFSITCAIDYPNGTPHLGHAYEKVVADCYARWNRLLGNEVFFLVGSDENGQNLVKTADAAGMTTQALVDQNVLKFKELFTRLNISNDDFIRTTEARHTEATHAIWKKLEAKDDIYFDKYQGWYCTNCEAYYTELQAPDHKCPEHHKPLDQVEEEGFFLRTSKYQKWITEYIRANQSFVVHDLSRNEILSRLEAEPMRDLSITRPNKGWGIPVPGKPEYVIYTWFDALINYYTASEPKGFWPNDTHVIGRDILWFHSVIWPIMLHASDLPLPKQVYVHGMVLAADGKKMSKSLGNGLDPIDVLNQVPVDSFRYYILRAIPAGANGAFVMEDLLKRHQSELGNDYGNLLMRVVKLWIKRSGPGLSSEGIKVAFDFNPLKKEIIELMEKREHHRALDRIWQEVNVLNSYVNDQKPWSIKEDEQKFREVIFNSTYGIDVLSQMLGAFLPETGAKALASLGRTPGVLNLDARTYQLSEPPQLFPRMEPKTDAEPAK